MPHSRYCALLFLGNPCSRSALCSGHPKKWDGFREQPLEPVPAMTLQRDRDRGSLAWSRGRRHAHPMLAQSQASPLLVTV